MPRLLVRQDDTGFVIHAATPTSVAPADQPRPTVKLGAHVRIDRRALTSSNMKDMSHGENR